MLLRAGLWGEGDGVWEGGEEGGEQAEVVREGGALAVEVGVGEGERVGGGGGGGGHCAGEGLWELLLV